MEPLEPRALLAVTAGIVAGDLRISLGAAADRAVFAGDGTRYFVSGTGLRGSVVVDVADVHGSIVVDDTAGRAEQSFVISKRTAIAHPLRVTAAVEATAILADVAGAGPLSIGSPRTRLAGDISTAASAAGVAFAGAVTLGRSVTISVGAGDVIFAGTVDGPHRLVANADGLTAFGGAVGRRTPLASLATDAGGGTVLAATIVTTGPNGQTYGDEVLLAGDVTSVAPSGGVRFQSTVDSTPESARRLSVRAAGAIVFGGAVGARVPLASVVTAGRGTTVIGGGSVTTAAGGRQVYHQAVRLAQDTLLNASDGAIRFAATVDGTDVTQPGAPTDLVAKRGRGRINLSWTAPDVAGSGVSLTTMTTGVTTYAGAVGGTTPLERVSGDRAVFTGPVRTVSVVDYVIQTSVDGGTTWRTIVDGRSSATSATLTGIESGRDYQVRVRGVNAKRVGEAATVASPAAPGITFHFVYGSGSDHWTAAARQALESTAASVAAAFVVGAPVDLTFSVTGGNSSDSGYLAWANSALVASDPGFHRTVVQEKVLTGRDSNGALPDGDIYWNFGYAFSYTDVVGPEAYDFRAIVMHELLHTFGFLSLLGEAGSNTATTWTAFDGFIVIADGTAAIDHGSFQWDVTYDPNLTGGNGGLFFGGPNAVAAHGGLVPLLTTDPYRAGSSFSHLDDWTFEGDDEKLMNAFKTRGTGIRVISPVERGILADLGYVVVAG